MLRIDRCLFMVLVTLDARSPHPLVRSRRSRLSYRGLGSAIMAANLRSGRRSIQGVPWRGVEGPSWVRSRPFDSAESSHRWRARFSCARCALRDRESAERPAVVEVDGALKVTGTAKGSIELRRHATCALVGEISAALTLDDTASAGVLRDVCYRETQPVGLEGGGLFPIVVEGTESRVVFDRPQSLLPGASSSASRAHRHTVLVWSGACG